MTQGGQVPTEGAHYQEGGRGVTGSMPRSLLHGPPRDEDVATRNEALGILNRLTRDGRVAAAMALARALGNDDAGEGDTFEES
jgi:hypothetical protein